MTDDMTTSQILTYLDNVEQPDRYLRLSYMGWYDNEIMGEIGEEDYDTTDC